MAKPLAVAYRRQGSFSRAFITIQSRSPRTGALYAALDMPFAGLVGQLAGAFAKGRLA